MDIHDSAIEAYQQDDQTAPERLRHYGAALSFAGIAENGGLVGGAIENLRETDAVDELTDALAGFRALGLSAVADLVERADSEYRRMRQGGASDDLSEADEALWEELDEEWFALDPTGSLDDLAASFE